MIYRVSIQNKLLTDQTVNDFVCPVCHTPGNFVMRKIRQTSRIFFIPFMRTTSDYHTVCPHCGNKFPFTAAQYKSICLSGPEQIHQQLHSAINAYVLHQKQGLSKFSERSPKNSAAAAILAFFLGVFGAQNIYLGHSGRVLISFGMDILAVLMFVICLLTKGTGMLLFFSAMLLAANIYWGIIDAIRIASGHAKDGSGLYVMTRKQFISRNRRLQNLTR